MGHAQSTISAAEAYDRSMSLDSAETIESMRSLSGASFRSQGGSSVEGSGSWCEYDWQGSSESFAGVLQALERMGLRRTCKIPESSPR